MINEFLFEISINFILGSKAAMIKAKNGKLLSFSKVSFLNHCTEWTELWNNGVFYQAEIVID